MGRDLRNSRREKARRLIDMARSGAFPLAMASPPTVSAISVTSAITGTTFAYNDIAITYLGTVPATVVYPDAMLQAHVNWNANSPGQRVGPLMETVFMTDAPNLELVVKQTGDLYRLFIDEMDGLGFRAVAIAPSALGTATFATAYLPVTFSGTGRRKIRLETTGLIGFVGVKVPNNYWVWKAAIEPLRLMGVGDSYAEGGYGDGTFNPMRCGARQMGYLLGVADTWVSGMSAEGYTKLGTKSGTTFGGRAATDVIAYSPDWVVGLYGINEAGSTPATVQTAVTSVYAALLTGLPNAIITVIGPLRAHGLNPLQSVADAIKAGVAAQSEYASDNTGRIAYIDTYADNWVQVGGRVGSTSGVGNTNLNIGADDIHPVQAGHDYYGNRYAQAVLTHARALAA